MNYFEKYKSYTGAFINLLGQKEKNLLDLYFNSLIKNAMPKGFIGEGREEELWLRHILDSILVLQKNEIVEWFQKADVVVDLGAGAGLPGIPLSILFPQTRFVLVETMEKRAKYILEIIDELELNHVSVINKRVEDVKRDDITGETRLVLFRAFLKPLVSLEMALRIITENSKVLYWRSRRFDISSEPGTGLNPLLQQINSRIREMGYDSPEFHNLECPPEMNTRGIYLIGYRGNSGTKYPRSWARIKKDLLINSVE